MIIKLFFLNGAILKRDENFPAGKINKLVGYPIKKIYIFFIKVIKYKIGYIYKKSVKYFLVFNILFIL